MTPQQKDALLQLADALPPADLEALMRFAEFLHSRAGAPLQGLAPVASAPPEPVEIPPPAEIPRPEEEKVVAAVKRLSQTYFMLDKKKMLGMTSDLVTQHVLHGREATAVIDELERAFAEQYRQLVQDGDG